MTVRELIEKLEHVTEHRLEVDVTVSQMGTGPAYEIKGVIDVGDAIEIVVDFVKGD